MSLASLEVFPMTRREYSSRMRRIISHYLSLSRSPNVDPYLRRVYRIVASRLSRSAYNPWVLHDAASDLYHRFRELSSRYRELSRRTRIPRFADRFSFLSSSLDALSRDMDYIVSVAWDRIEQSLEIYWRHYPTTAVYTSSSLGGVSSGRGYPSPLSEVVRRD